jgi:DEAD/DEAH box helicase domain-containing protein
MSYRLCPRCSGYVEVQREGKRFRVRCSECSLSYLTNLNEANDPVAAYLQFVDFAERGEPAQRAPVPSGRRAAASSSQAEPKTPRTREEWQHQLKAAGVPSIKALPEVLQRILMDPANLLVKYEQFPETMPPLGSFVDQAPIRAELQDTLRRQGVTRLFQFQEEAIRAILAGKDVVISAPTATGKTEAFAVPVLEQIASRRLGWGPLRAAEGRSVQALFIYPTKALSRDQAKKLATLAASVGLEVAVLDGDTPKAQRDEIFHHPPDVLITNPDLLHVHLIRPKGSVRRLLRSVRHVVLDELHIYVGAFGANVHFLLRRLQRLCPPLQLIGASATVSNAQEFAELLFARSVEPVECGSGKKGIIHFLMLYPERVSQSTMIASVAQELVRHRFKTLVFANTHRNAEVINLIAQRTRLASAVHRAGLPPAYRRQVEEEFRQGKLDLLVATPTLELGIDIGDLDGVVSMLVGITRLIQRIGRAGRKGQESIAVLALRGNDAISRYYREHPQDYFTDIDPAYVEPRNEVVAQLQLAAAALDAPLQRDEFTDCQPAIQELVKQGILADSGSKFTANLTAARQLLARTSIRGIGDTVYIVQQGRIIGERQMPTAMAELHPGAYYLHAGKTYQAVDFQFRHSVGRAVVEPTPPGHHEMTQALRHVTPQIIRIRDTRSVFGVTVYYADLRMTEAVTGYVVKDIFTEKILKVQQLDHPLEYVYPTKGFFFTAPQASKAVAAALSSPGGKHLPGAAPVPNGEPTEKLKERELLGGAFHALEHVLIESSNMLTGGGSHEMGGVSLGDSGVIFIYDGSPGGSGLSRLLYKRLEEAFRRAAEILQSCPCTAIDGCPACTYSYQCGNNNAPLFKAGAYESASLILKGSKTLTEATAVPVEEAIV